MTIAYSYDDNHRLTEYSYTPGNGTKTFAWDNAGNLTKTTPSEGPAREYYWDARNLLTKVKQGELDRVTYSYDSLGRLWQRYDHSADTTTTYYFEGLTPVVEIVDDGETTLTKRHRAVPGALGNVLQTYDGTNKTYYAYDRLGNVLAGYDGDGAAVVDEVVDAFGYPQGGTPGDFSLTTKMRDPATNLYYFNARWYDPDVGRFISAEPTWIDGPNLYHFNFNDPVNRVDFDGLRSWRDSGGINSGTFD
jgi:RHS repeat-associated protein